MNHYVATATELSKTCPIISEKGINCYQTARPVNYRHLEKSSNLALRDGKKALVTAKDYLGQQDFRIRPENVLCMEGGHKNKGNRHWFPRYEAWARNTCKEEAKIVVKLDIKDRRDKTFDLTHLKKRALRVQGICVVSTTVKIFPIVAVVTVLDAVIIILTNYSYSKESLENL